MKAIPTAATEIETESDKLAADLRKPDLQQIRSKRLSSISDSLPLKLTIVGNGEGRILNLSETGLAFVTEKAIGKNKEVEIKIGFDGDRTIYSGTIVTAWERPEGRLFAVGGKFTSHILSESLPHGLETAGSIYRDVQAALTDMEALPMEFRSFVMDFRVYLKSLKQRLDDLEKKLVATSLDTKNSFKKAIELWVAPQAIEQITKYNLRLNELISKLKTKEIRMAAIHLFRSELNEFLVLSPFTERAMNKPRGYAGDYEMMNQIYRDEFEGGSLFSQIIHKYSINEASSRSVRFRRDFLIGKFKEFLTNRKGNLTFGSMACGPAREVMDFLKTGDLADIARCNFVLIDQDSEALINCKRNAYQIVLERGIKHEPQYVPVSVKDVLERTLVLRHLENKSFDLLYTAGLYDYLSQPLARAVTQELLGMVKPGGHLIIGNFHPANPTKAISEFSVDWRLIHRTQEDMMDLVPESLKATAKILADDQNIDLFVDIVKP